jgi:hypothetical protein
LRQSDALPVVLGQVSDDTVGHLFQPTKCQYSLNLLVHALSLDTLGFCSKP